MVPRKRTDTAINSLRLIPTQWAIVVVVLLIGYVLLQPRLNQWFGWKLPAAASLIDDEKPVVPAGTKPVRKSDPPESPSKNSVVDEKPAEKAQDGKAKESQPLEPDDRVHGVLKDLGRNRFESPEGLIYGPGSEEGHRLKHIERHLEDQPARPGPHGVFQGEMKDFLQAIDRTFAMASKGSKGTSKKEDNGATIYEAAFDKPIGFLGGTDGKRKNKPALKRMRVVVRGKSVITAFPVK